MERGFPRMQQFFTDFKSVAILVLSAFHPFQSGLFRVHYVWFLFDSGQDVYSVSTR
jgi:hypothetical protein